MSVYDLEKLMEETRRIAAEYRRSTGSVLPVGPELAKFDALKLLGLTNCEQDLKGVDAHRTVAGELENIQIKSRVVFDQDNPKARVGQLNAEGDWDVTLLVIMDANYEPAAIYELSRSALESAFPDSDGLKTNARGAMSVKKFIALSTCVWACET